MENQHRKISGYRDLSQAEIDLMNRIKAYEAEALQLVRDVLTQLGTHNANIGSDTEEPMRFANAEPYRWAAIARTDLQTGFMALVRAVAQPVTP